METEKQIISTMLNYRVQSLHYMNAKVTKAQDMTTNIYIELLRYIDTYLTWSYIIII